MADVWFVGNGGERSGPFSADVLREMAAGGRLAPTDLVWREGMAAWAPATSIPGLFAVSRATSASPLTDNPYAAPAVSDNVTALGDAKTLGLASRPYSFAAAFSLAVNTFKSQWIILFLAGLILLGVGVAVSVPQWIAQAVGMASGDPGVFQLMALVGSILGFALNLLVSGHVFAGSIVAAANAARGHGRVSDVFLGFKRYGTVLLATVLVSLISLVVVFVAYIPVMLAFLFAISTRGPNGDTADSASAIVGFALLTTVVLTILGFALVIIRVSYAPAIAADPESGGIGAVDAIRMNWQRTSAGTGFSLFGLVLVVAVIMVVSLILLCVGYFLLGIPFALGAVGAAYQLLFRSDRTATPAR